MRLASESVHMLAEMGVFKLTFGGTKFTTEVDIQKGIVDPCMILVFMICDYHNMMRL